MAGDRIGFRQAWNPVTDQSTLIPILKSASGHHTALRHGDWLVEYIDHTNNQQPMRPPAFAVKEKQTFQEEHQPAED